MAEDRERGIAADAITAVRILEVEAEQRQQILQAFRLRNHATRLRVLAEPVGDPVGLIRERGIGGYARIAELGMRIRRVLEGLEDVGRDARRQDRRWRVDDKISLTT